MESYKIPFSTNDIYHPIRNRILELLLGGRKNEEELIGELMLEKVLHDKSYFKYHINTLLQAECVEQMDDFYFSLTRKGVVVLELLEFEITKNEILIK
ncbi:MAG: hypothetical protein ACFFCS_08490 [Candidatus Hodarchaeota archaeon]